MKTIELKSLESPSIQFDISHDPHGSLQWKGSDIYMDVHCDCGHTSNVKGDSVYFVKCPACNTIYELNGFVQLIKRPDIVEKNHEVEVKAAVL